MGTSSQFDDAELHMAHDPFCGRGRVPEHLVGRKTEGFVTVASEPQIPGVIRLRAVVMLLAVNFDDRQDFVAVEVGDIWAERSLTLEQESVGLATLQQLPQEHFGQGHVRSEVA